MILTNNFIVSIFGPHNTYTISSENFLLRKTVVHTFAENNMFSKLYNFFTNYNVLHKTYGQKRRKIPFTITIVLTFDNFPIICCAHKVAMQLV